MQQWFLKTTAFAPELLDMQQLEGGWPERVLAMQRNWIGKSEGAEIDFTLEGSGEKIRIFTTRIDTIYGATCLIVAPEHPLVEKLVTDAGERLKVKEMIDFTARQDESNAQKIGQFTGKYAIQPFAGRGFLSGSATLY